jgi:hypothetical protein
LRRLVAPAAPGLSESRSTAGRGVNAGTVQRLIDTLMASLGTKTRFQTVPATVRT